MKKSLLHFAAENGAPSDVCTKIIQKGIPVDVRNKVSGVFYHGEC